MKGQGRDPNIFHACYLDTSKTARDRDSVNMLEQITQNVQT